MSQERGDGGVLPLETGQGEVSVFLLCGCEGGGMLIYLAVFCGVLYVECIYFDPCGSFAIFAMHVYHFVLRYFVWNTILFFSELTLWSR